MPGITTSVSYINSSVKITLKDLSDTSDWKYTKMLEKDIEDVKCIVILFSLKSKSSFEHLKLLVDFIFKTKCETNHLPIIICGNKSDLVYNNQNSSNNNLSDLPQANFDISNTDQDAIIPQQTINDFIRRIPDCSYIEISCKNNTNIHLVKKNILDLNLEKIGGDNISELMANNKKGGSCLVF